ncbi:MAG: nuclear transport factor 2 family protein [Acidimicrobiia bacterium]
MTTEGPEAAGADVVEELARRFQSGGDAFAMFHPQVRLEQPASLPHGGWHEGHDGIKAMSVVFAEHWDRAFVGEPRITGCGASAVQVTTQTWTAKTTGRSATVDVVELFEFADGLIAEVRVFQQDTHLLLGTLDPE